MKDSFLTKRGDNGALNPFDRGSIFLNFCYILCGPAPPSLINLRAKLTPKTDITLNGHFNSSSIANSKNGGHNSNIDTFYSIHA